MMCTRYFEFLSSFETAGALSAEARRSNCRSPGADMECRPIYAQGAADTCIPGMEDKQAAAFGISLASHDGTLYKKRRFWRIDCIYFVDFIICIPWSRYSSRLQNGFQAQGNTNLFFVKLKVMQTCWQVLAVPETTYHGFKLPWWMAFAELVNMRVNDQVTNKMLFRLVKAGSQLNVQVLKKHFNGKSPANYKMFVEQLSVHDLLEYWRTHQPGKVRDKNASRVVMV